MTKLYKRSRSKKQELFLAIILVGIFFMFSTIVRLNYGDFFDDIPKTIVFDYLQMPDDVRCYHEDFGTPDPLHEIPKHAIFLISASCESFLSIEQACAIEAVSRSHIDKRIFVFTNRPLRDCKCTLGLQNALNTIPSLQFVRIQIDKFVENTPLKGIFDEKFLSIGVRKHKRITEILKFVTLYKFGGVVIDLDMILAKPITFLGLNYGVRMNKTMLSSAIVGIKKDSLLAQQLVPLVLNHLKNQSANREIYGGKALTDAFKEMCYDSPRPGCVDFQIYDEKYFFPYNETSNYMYSQEGDLDPMVYGYYIWDTRRIVKRKRSLYNRLMNEYCPTTMSFLN